MSSKAPYISEQYKHLISHSQGQPDSNPSQQNIYFQPSQNNHFPSNQFQPGQYNYNQFQSSQQPIVFLPSAQHSPYNNPVTHQRVNNDSYATDQPNNLYPSINSYEKPYYGNYGKPQNHQTPSSNNTPQEDKQVVHKVQYGDTLQGLSLLYDTSISKIRQRNNIEGDSIYYLKQLIIPNPKASPLQSAKTQEMMIEQFMDFMPIEERSDKTARFYLNDNEWKMEDAVKAFKEDLEWERKNKVQFSTVPIKNKQNPNDYSLQQLLIKKST